MTKDDAHWSEVDRLWQAVKRDFFAEVMVGAGFKQHDQRRTRRLDDNWRALCDLELPIAGRLYHGMNEIVMSFARHGEPSSPADHNLRAMGEFLGVVTAGRDANPDVEVKTAGELYDLGVEAIRSEVERDLGEGGDAPHTS